MNPVVYKMNKTRIKLISELQDRVNIVKSMRVYTIGIETELGKKEKISKLEIKENFQIC